MDELVNRVTILEIKQRDTDFVVNVLSDVIAELLPPDRQPVLRQALESRPGRAPVTKAP